MLSGTWESGPRFEDGRFKSLLVHKNDAVCSVPALSLISARAMSILYCGASVMLASKVLTSTSAELRVLGCRKLARCTI